LFPVVPRRCSVCGGDVPFAAAGGCEVAPPPFPFSKRSHVTHEAHSATRAAAARHTTDHTGSGGARSSSWHEGQRATRATPKRDARSQQLRRRCYSGVRALGVDGRRSAVLPPPVYGRADLSLLGAQGRLQAQFARAGRWRTSAGWRNGERLSCAQRVVVDYSLLETCVEGIKKEYKIPPPARPPQGASPPADRVKHHGWPRGPRAL